ncbi:MAG: fused MFS/spermidine synthase [Dermabacter sp.]|nr:fused MFS/spermidine synthase [Dermabacter sp.]
MARRSTALPLHLPYFEDITTTYSTVRLEPETDGSFTVIIDGMESSHIHPDPTHLVFEYMRWIAAVITGTYPSEQPLAIAHLGGGAAALPRAIATLYPASKNSVVELDPGLLARVRDWVDLPRAPRVALRAADAFEALHAWRDARFDIIIRDAFSHSLTPPPLRSAEAATQAKRVLVPGGLYLANAALAPDQKELADEIVTLRSVFGHIEVIAEPSALKKRRRSNCILIAGGPGLSEATLRAIRADPVSVRVLEPSAVDKLAAGGTITHAEPPAPPA